MPASRIILLCTRKAKDADAKVKDAGYRCIEEIRGEKEWLHEGLMREGEEGETCLMCYSSGTVCLFRAVSPVVVARLVKYGIVVMTWMMELICRLEWRKV